MQIMNKRLHSRILFLFFIAFFSKMTIQAQVDTLVICSGQSITLDGGFRNIALCPVGAQGPAGTPSPVAGTPANIKITWEGNNIENPNIDTIIVKPNVSGLYRQIVENDCDCPVSGPGSPPPPCNGGKKSRVAKEIYIKVLTNCNPPTPTTTNCNTFGTFFFESCNGSTYYFIKLDNGKVYDPYFASNINFEPTYNGQRVKFGYKDTSYVSPCSQAEKAIQITCLEEIKTNAPRDTVKICRGERVSLLGFGGITYSCPCTPSGGPCEPFVGISESFWTGINLDLPNNRGITNSARPTYSTLYTNEYFYRCPPPPIGTGPAGPAPPSGSGVLKEVYVNVDNTCAAPCSYPYEGTIFFAQCNQKEYFFVRMPDGKVYDPHFANGVNFTVKNGQKVKFDYYNSLVNTPCSQAEKGITITCIEEVATPPTTTPLFQTYPWLSSNVDINNCVGTTISEYNMGSYSFVYVSSPTKSTLYFENGMLYCEGSPSYNCLALYGLSNRQPSRTYTCSSTPPIQNPNPTDNTALTTYPWLSTVLEATNCCKNKEVIEYKVGSHAYIYVKPDANCSNGFGKLYNKAGAFYCGDGPGYNCVSLYNLSGGNVIWRCTNTNATNPNTEAVFLKSNTGVKPLEATQLRAYPNPTSDIVNIEIKNIKDVGQLNMYDIYGRILMTRNYDKPQLEIFLNVDISEYKAGIYLLEWRSRGHSTIKKIIKQ
jgi:hypothetical protein